MVIVVSCSPVVYITIPVKKIHGKRIKKKTRKKESKLRTDKHSQCNQHLWLCNIYQYLYILGTNCSKGTHPIQLEFVAGQLGSGLQAVAAHLVLGHNKAMGRPLKHIFTEKPVYRIMELYPFNGVAF